MAGPLLAQNPGARTGELSGTVFDSVARVPVVDAAIQLVPKDNPALRMYAGVSDSAGRFLIGGIEPGEYIVGFHHVALDSLALEPPVRIVRVRGGERSEVALAVPSPSRIVAAFCGPGAAADSVGLVLGALRDARTQMGIDTGTVQARWHELVVDSTGLSQSTKTVTSPVRQGWFVLCGVPAAVDVGIFGWNAADTTGFLLVTVPVDGLSRRDLFVRGTAVVRGSVVSERNRPIAGARVGFAGRARSVTTDSAGRFHFGEAAAGSQTLEVRAIGFAPETRPLMLAANGDTTLAIRLTSVRKLLDTLRVVGQRVYNRNMVGFERRKRMGFGTFFDAATIRRRASFDLSQLFRMIPSMRVVENGFDRTIYMRGALGYCPPDLFVNGMRLSQTFLGNIDLVARPSEVLAMEVYRGTQTPPEFQSLSGCGAIVIWTR